ncbi:hypothetical protein LAZ67_12000229 [Cordylochernes scorpioides]|uniref:Transposase n=1 Tax=Cordylochernes scorpioides TaxID=51811 RepID=A0ABY6L158_9ARAC|nr:hypothetical protein LAZ67_12000229 [Cordylochernes scorpioides]
MESAVFSISSSKWTTAFGDSINLLRTISNISSLPGRFTDCGRPPLLLSNFYVTQTTDTAWSTRLQPCPYFLTPCRPGTTWFTSALPMTRLPDCGIPGISRTVWQSPSSLQSGRNTNTGWLLLRHTGFSRHNVVVNSSRLAPSSTPGFNMTLLLRMWNKRPIARQSLLPLHQGMRHRCISMTQKPKFNPAMRATEATKKIQSQDIACYIFRYQRFGSPRIYSFSTYNYQEVYLGIMKHLRDAVCFKRPERWQNNNWILHVDNERPHTSYIGLQF